MAAGAWEKLAGAGALAGLLAVAFPDVVLGPRTFSAAAVVPSIHPRGLTPEPEGGRTFIDPGASAWCDEPYALMIRRAFAAGEVPLWNPASACGAPLLADFLSAPFYPTALLAQALPRTWRRDGFVLLRLLTAGWFTFLLLRQLGLGRAAALLGGSAFMLGGHPVLYANINNASVDVMHPAVLYGVERLARTGRWRLLALLTAWTVLGGMPEPIVFVLIGGGLWFVFRSLIARPDGAPPFRALAARYALGSAVGLLIASPAVLPFLEFVRNGAHWHTEPSGTAAWEPRTAMTILEPGCFRFSGGGPVALQLGASMVAPYVGFLAAFLALVGLGASRLGRVRWFLAGVAAFYLLKAYGAPVVNEVGRLPILVDCIFPKYLFPAFALAVACLAAAGAERLAAGRAGTLLAWSALAGAWVVFHAMHPPGRPALVYGISGSGGPLTGGLPLVVALAVARLARGRAALPLSAAAVLGELLVHVPRERARRVERIEEPAFLANARGDGRVLATGGWLTPNWAAALGRDDVRVVDAMTVRRYAEFIRATVEPAMGNDRWMGDERRCYDPSDRWLRFLDVRWLVFPEPLPRQLPRRLLADGERWTRGRDAVEGLGPGEFPSGIALARPGEVRLALRLPEGRPALAFEHAGGPLEVALREPVAFAPVFVEHVDPKHVPAHRGWLPRRVDLSAWRGREATILLFTTPGPRGNAAYDWAGFAELGLGGTPLDPAALLRTAACGVEEPHYAEAAVAETPEGPRPLLFLHPPGVLELTARIPEERPELTFRIGLRPEVHDPARGDGVDFGVALAPRGTEEVVWSGGPGAARAELDSRAGRDALLVLRARGPSRTELRGLALEPSPVRLVHGGGPWVYRSDEALPRAFVVHRAEVETDEARALRRLAEPDFDPSRTVLLHDPVPVPQGPGPGGGAGTARIARAGRHEVLVEATLASPGFLVTSEVFYPGWSVEVDGAPRALHRANHAFRAVALDAGRHEVRFRYACLPWRIGLALAAAGLTLLVLPIARARPPRPPGT